MAGANDQSSDAKAGAGPEPGESLPGQAEAGSTAGAGAAPGQAEAGSTTGAGAAPAEPNAPPAATPPGGTPPERRARRPRHRWRKWIVLLLVLIALAIAVWLLLPWLIRALMTISTDDAYIHGHATFVSPRVMGQVISVLVDDNYRVKKGDVLVRLDPEPYRVKVAIQQAALGRAQTELFGAQAQARATEGQARAQRWAVQTAIDQVNSQIAQLHVDVARYRSAQAELALAQANLRRAEALAPVGGVSKEELDVRRHTVTVDEAHVAQALESVYAARAALGLTPKPPTEEELTKVPPDLDQTYSSVRTALGNLIQTAARLGLPLPPLGITPRQYIAEFPKKELTQQTPPVKQAEAALARARRDLEQAELNLRYCVITSDIDGVVTSRKVNPGNNVKVGQTLMVVRSVNQIWVEANFKETQLVHLRIGQRVHCRVDMYGSRQKFEGRITGFTMGTGQTLALLPPENATGNFVKVVQRLPVRIELTNYDPEKAPLFVGLSVVPYVYYKEPPTGPHAGEVLQPPASLPTSQPGPKP